MIRQHLIDAIVRQTTVLIASLATAGGRRAPMAHFADRVFADLVEELEAQGIGKKVSADMFGMALRTYQRRVQRLRAGAESPGPTVWQLLLEELDQEGPMTRAQLEELFPEEEELVIAAVLRDLRDSGMVTVSREDDVDTYNSVELPTPEDSDAALEELLRVILYRRGPLTLRELQQSIRVPEEELQACLDTLVESTAVVQEEEGGALVYRSHGFLIPHSSTTGWEAALFDHFAAVVQTFCSKLHRGPISAYDDTIGGSTFSVTVWPGHPLEERVKSTLKATREELSRLRQEVRAYNASHKSGPDAARITTYIGQNAVPIEEVSDQSESA